MRDGGYDVHLVARGPLTDQDGITHHVLEGQVGATRINRVLRGAWLAWGILKRIQPSVVHVHDPELILFAALWKISHRCVVIYDAHEFLPKQVQGKDHIPAPLRPIMAVAARILERFAAKMLDGIVVAVPLMLNEFGSAKSVCLVQNFPWSRDFPSPSPAPRQGRLAYVGAVSVGRGIDVMLKVVEMVPSSSLILAGPAQPAELEDRIKARDRVAYLGRVPPSMVPEVLADADVGMCVLLPLPNYLNAQSTKIFEYMAAGRPIVYSNFPRWIEQLASTGCGIAVDPQSAEAVKECGVATDS